MNYFKLDSRLNFVSESNEVMLHFHSDYSVVASGFALSWRSVDVSGCPLHTLTAQEGILTSPNYPHFLLDHLHCSTTILAPGELLMNCKHIFGICEISVHWLVIRQASSCLGIEVC